MSGSTKVNNVLGPEFTTVRSRDDMLFTSQLMTPVDSRVDCSIDSKVGQALFEKIAQVDHHSCEPDEEDSFFVCDLDEVKRLYHNWCAKLPRVTPFYAIKCNNDPMVLRTLMELGAGFDCASKGEIEKMLSLGVSPERIIYANPCKSTSYIRYARDQSINLMTFDNADELVKMARHHPGSKLLLRIVTDDDAAQCRLSTKFGATLPQAIELLKLAKDLHLDVCGVAFHVGSGSSDHDALAKAIGDSKVLFEFASSLGFDMNVLDIGGGFVLDSFDSAAKVANASLESHFPAAQYAELRIIAEPGRYMAASAFTLACHVIAKRSYFEPDTGIERHMVYLNDGVYGNLNCIIYDHQSPVAKTLTHGDRFYHDDDADYEAEVSIWGPTCDGLDCIAKSQRLKFIPQVGDWVYFENVGAYTSVASTPFNGFKQTGDVIYV